MFTHLSFDAQTDSHVSLILPRPAPIRPRCRTLRAATGRSPPAATPTARTGLSARCRIAQTLLSSLQIVMHPAAMRRDMVLHCCIVTGSTTLLVMLVMTSAPWTYITRLHCNSLLA